MLTERDPRARGGRFSSCSWISRSYRPRGNCIPHINNVPPTREGAPLRTRASADSADRESRYTSSLRHGTATGDAGIRPSSHSTGHAPRKVCLARSCCP